MALWGEIKTQSKLGQHQNTQLLSDAIFYNNQSISSPFFHLPPWVIAYMTWMDEFRYSFSFSRWHSNKPDVFLTGTKSSWVSTFPVKTLYFLPSLRSRLMMWLWVPCCHFNSTSKMLISLFPPTKHSSNPLVPHPDYCHCFQSSVFL